MSSLASVVIDSTEELTQPDLTVTVDVDFEGNVSVDNQFIRIPDQGSAIISWKLSSSLTDVVFDNPGIRLLGNDQPDMVWQLRSDSEWKALWYNNDPDKRSRSFSYRVHVVRVSGGQYTPYSTDPIVRNDPPPAPMP